MSPSTLYAVIKRLLESGLIEELSERPDPAHDDERRRYYRLTALGRRVAESEAARLTRLLADAGRADSCRGDDSDARQSC